MPMPMHLLRSRTWGFLLGFAVCAGVLGSEDSGVQGWRRDGRGLYPECTPPLTWSREAVDPVVKTLIAQSDKPKGDDASQARPIPDGIIRQWLVLGAFPQEGAGDLEQDYLGGEGAVEPAKDAKAGPRNWTALEIPTDRETNEKGIHVGHLHPGYGIGWAKLTGREKGKVRYAHAYLHSPRAAKRCCSSSTTAG
ncbi:MAG: hypothetical protein M5U26_04885 [Planctomycetota bacterium]|nr:hypothetical protein [Planctomycetota bacterium]